MECTLGAAIAANALEFAPCLSRRPNSPDPGSRSRSAALASAEPDGANAPAGNDRAAIASESGGEIIGIATHPTYEHPRLRAGGASVANDLFRVLNGWPKRSKSPHGFTSGSALARRAGQNRPARKGQSCVERVRSKLFGQAAGRRGLQLRKLPLRLFSTQRSTARKGLAHDFDRRHFAPPNPKQMGCVLDGNNAIFRPDPLARSKRRHIRETDRGIAFGAAVEPSAKSGSSDNRGCAGLPAASSAGARACAFRECRRIRTQDSVVPDAYRTLPRPWRSCESDDWSMRRASTRRVPSRFMSSRMRNRGKANSESEAKAKAIQNSARRRFASASGASKQAIDQCRNLSERRPANTCGLFWRRIRCASPQPVRHAANQDKSGGRAATLGSREFPLRNPTAMPVQRIGRKGPRVSEWPQLRNLSDFAAMLLPGGSRSASRRPAGKVGCSASNAEFWESDLAGRASFGSCWNFDELPSSINRIPSHPSFVKKRQEIRAAMQAIPHRRAASAHCNGALHSQPADFS